MKIDPRDLRVEVRRAAESHHVVWGLSNERLDRGDSGGDGER